MKRLAITQYREVLDYVLENTLEQKDYFHVKDFFCYTNETFPEKDEYYLKMVLNQLRNDGYIDFIRWVDGDGIFVDQLQAGERLTIRRNFNGHIFSSNGGYQEQENKRKADEQAKNEAQIRSDSYAKELTVWTSRLAIRTRWLMWATWAVALGAIGLVAWEIWHTYH